MIKNITIALLIGVIVGQTCKADTAVNLDSITRRDLFTAAALCGILASPNHGRTVFDPYNSPTKVCEGANHYADELAK